MELKNFRFVDKEGLAHKLRVAKGCTVIKCSGVPLESVVCDHGPSHERGLKSCEVLEQLGSLSCPACN